MLPYVRKYLRTKVPSKVLSKVRKYVKVLYFVRKYESTKVLSKVLSYFGSTCTFVRRYFRTSVHTLSICLRSVNKRRAHSEYCSGRGVSKPTTCSVCSSVHRQCRSQCGNLIEVGDYKFSIDGRDSDAISTESRCKTSLFPRFENNMLHSAFCI